MNRAAKFFIFLFLSAIVSVPQAGYSLELIKTGFLDRNFAGGRFGIFSSIGDETVPEDSPFDLQFSDQSAYAEFFYAYRFARPLALEISLGIYSRGDVRYDSNEGVVNEPVNIYPIWLSAKLYPFYSIKLPFHPFVQPGGGIVYGRHRYVYAPEPWIYYQDSEVKFTYIAGGGIDWPISEKVALTMGFKYSPAKFSNALAGVEDYSGWTLAFGAGYVFGN